ncbi:hypothetical protein ACHAXH_008973 [Discostella pseudostelligera]
MCATATATSVQIQTTQSQTPRISRRLQRQRVCSILLDSVTAIFILHYLYNHPSYLNPWNLPNVKLWFVGFICIRLGVMFYDHLVVLVVEKYFKSKVLPTRESGAPPVRFVKLDTRSYIYLFLNAFNEYSFVMRLTHYLWQGGHQQLLSWQISQFTLGNTLVAFGIMFISMDMLYAPLHHLLHLPTLYPLIHKHHHRQHFPTRGYLDAGNEHPIEHMIGVMCTWFAVCASEIALPTLGMLSNRIVENGLSWQLFSSEDGEFIATRGGGVHAITVMIFFQFHAALACLNHSPYNVQFSLPAIGSSAIFGSNSKLLHWVNEIPHFGKWVKRLVSGQWFQYAVGHHEMHHRKFNFNYGQYCMFYDLWMGTFIEYEGPMTAAQLLESKKRM